MIDVLEIDHRSLSISIVQLTNDNVNCFELMFSSDICLLHVLIESIVPFFLLNKKHEKLSLFSENYNTVFLVGWHGQITAAHALGRAKTSNPTPN